MSLQKTVKIFLIGLIVCLSFIATRSTFASTISAQYDYSTASTTGGGVSTRFAQKIGTGLSGTIVGIKVRAFNSSLTDARNWQPEAGLLAFTNSDYTGFVSACEYGGGSVRSIPANQGDSYIFTDFDSTCGGFATLNSSYYYAFVWLSASNGTHADVKALGSATGTSTCIYNGGNPSLNCTGTDSTLNSIYYILDTTDVPVDYVPPSATCVDGIMNQDETAIDYGGVCISSEITNVLANGVTPGVNTSTPVDLRIYYNNISGHEYQYIHYTLDVEGYDTSYVASHLPSTTGLGLVYEKLALPVQAPLTYNFTIILSNGSEANQSYSGDSSPYNFSLTTVAPNPAIVYQDCASGEIDCYLQNAGSWLFQIAPGTLERFSTLTLRDSIPFSYLYDTPVIFNEFFSNSGSREYAVSVTTGLGTINFISKDMIEAVPYSSTIKTLLGYLIYFFTAMTIYRILLGTFSQNKDI